MLAPRHIDTNNNMLPSSHTTTKNIALATKCLSTYRILRLGHVDSRVLVGRFNAIRSLRTSCLLSAETTNSESTNSDYDAWEPVDIEADLALLRLAVAESRAEDEKKEGERKFLLDTFAKQRRAVYPDVIKFILAPLLFATILSVILSPPRTLNSVTVATRFPTGKTIASRIVHLMNAHYWLIVLLSPLAALWDKWRSMKKSIDKAPSRASEWDLDWEDPHKSCRDHILCILEGWSSSVVVAAVFETCRRVIPAIRRQVLLSSHSRFGRFIPIALASSQLFNRLGAAAALHQYPKLLFELRRSNQPRPLEKFAALTQALVGLSLAWLPFGFACDVVNLLVSFHWDRRRCWSLLNDRLCFIALATYVGAIASTIGPIIHLVAIKRIFRFQISNNLSLATDHNVAMKALSDPNKGSHHFKLRYRINWRKPKRISQTLLIWWRSFASGYVPPTERSESTQNVIDSALKTQKQLYDSTIFGPKSKDGWRSPILRLAEKYEEDNLDAPQQDREAWVPKAIQDMAAIHQRDYENKDFVDPLGVAVQQTLGIGLSYDFDHDTRVKCGTNPSVHQLRARAAKSAVRRVQRLYNPAIARDRLDRIDDPVERRRVGAMMRQENEEEVRRLANALLELIPTNAPPPRETEPVTVEMVLQSDAGLQTSVPSMDSFVASKKVDEFTELSHKAFAEEGDADAAYERIYQDDDDIYSDSRNRTEVEGDSGDSSQSSIVSKDVDNTSTQKIDNMLVADLHAGRYNGVDDEENDEIRTYVV